MNRTTSARCIHFDNDSYGAAPAVVVAIVSPHADHTFDVCRNVSPLKQNDNRTLDCVTASFSKVSDDYLQIPRARYPTFSLK